MSSEVQLPHGNLHQHIFGGPPCVCTVETTAVQREQMLRMAAWYVEVQITAGNDPVAALVDIADRESTSPTAAPEPDSLAVDGLRAAKARQRVADILKQEFGANLHRDNPTIFLIAAAVRAALAGADPQRAGGSGA